MNTKQKVLYHFPGSGYVAEAAATFARSPGSTKKQMANMFGKQGESLFKLLEFQDIELLGKMVLMRKLRKGLLRRLLDSPLTVVGNKIRRHLPHWQRIRKRPGIFVAVLGLDGAGKTTLINLARRDLERLLHGTTECRHWRPDFLPRLAALMGRDIDKTGAPNPNPHGKPPSGSLVSILRLAYYSVDYILGFWLSILPKLIKSEGGANVVFFDRYFCDYFIDPARYSVSSPEWIVRLFWLVVPKPDLIIMLRPEPEIVYARKPELPVEELRRQGERMCLLAKKLKHVVWIDTSGMIESSCQAMVQAVLDTFARRVK